jgi:uncharacterized membrane protein
MRPAATAALVAVFSALIVATDFALAPLVNVKLMDPLVFLVAFLFGFRRGAAVAAVSELVWSFVSPWGMAGAITPFLVGGELMFAAGGWWASRLWGGADVDLAAKSAYIGALMFLCAFLWDLETNAATAILAFWPSLSLQSFVGTEALGIPFAVVHEAADFAFGATVAPTTVLLGPRLKWRGG